MLAAKQNLPTSGRDWAVLLLLRRACMLTSLLQGAAAAAAAAAAGEPCRTLQLLLSLACMPCTGLAKRCMTRPDTLHCMSQVTGELVVCCWWHSKEQHNCRPWTAQDCQVSKQCWEGVNAKGKGGIRSPGAASRASFNLVTVTPVQQHGSCGIAASLNGAGA